MIQKKTIMKTFAPVAILLFLTSCNLNSVPSYTVIVDPGHGGAPILRKDDKWDPVSRT